jgi:hypothetical protein
VYLPLFFLLLIQVNITDTSQFGQDQGGDDIHFYEEFSGDEEEAGAGNAASAEDMGGSGNPNRNNNKLVVGRDMYDDMTDSDESDSDEDE